MMKPYLSLSKASWTMNDTLGNTLVKGDNIVYVIQGDVYRGCVSKVGIDWVITQEEGGYYTVYPDMYPVKIRRISNE